MNALWVLMAVTLEVAVSIRRAPSSVCVTLSLASSWEVIREPVLVRFTVKHAHLESAQPPHSLFPPCFPLLCPLSFTLSSFLASSLPLLPLCSLQPLFSLLSTHKPLNQMSMSVHKTSTTANNFVATLWGHSPVAVKEDISWI